MKSATDERDAATGDRADEPATGIECPRCGCQHLPVAYVRHVVGRTKRVRQCRNCDRRVVTYESVAGSKVTPV